MKAEPADRKPTTADSVSHSVRAEGKNASLALDPKASAALAEAVLSARKTGVSAPTRKAEDEQRLQLPRHGFGRTKQLAVHSALVLVLAGSCWLAAYASNFTNRDALQQIAADTAQHRAALARLDHNLEVLQSVVSVIRDKSAKASDQEAEERQRLARGLDRIAIASAGPGERIAALEARIDRMEQQITAAILNLAPKLEAPAVQVKAEATKAEPDAKPVTEAKTADPQTTAAVKSVVVRDEVVAGWTLREVYDGAALIESRNRRLFEVVPGGFIPGVGRVSSIERRSGRWIVLTERGVIGTVR